MKASIVCVFLFLAFSSWSLERARILQVDHINSKVAVKVSKAVKVNDVFVATAKNGRQCSLVIVNKKGDVALADSSNCDFSAQFRVGQVLTQSLAKPASSSSQAAVSRGSSSNQLQQVREKLKGFSAFGYYNLAEDMEVSAAGQNSTVIGEKALGLGLEYKTQYAGVGLTAGSAYELNREFSKYKSQGQTVSYKSKPELNFWSHYVNALLELTPELEINGGLNYNFPKLKNAGKEELKGDFGYQFGVSYKINQDIAIDGIYRKLNMKGKGGEVDDADLTGLLFRGRYVF